MTDQLQLFKNIIFILNPTKTLKILSKELKDKLSEKEIAYAIWDTSKICPLCHGSGFVNKDRCYICNTTESERPVDYYLNRFKYFKEILSIVPQLWSKLITDKDVEG
ncbi:MAG: hypothetical protein OMM_09853 [Candidatus Magnetoglobus multicellularis str. Araruama]|uniref:Uncharacterized protein n=1 Tax=Candidatus Magnetoglobus multicellularis str. Araruama TaxID=890399 RepID=A0A1V1P2X0_9BACT|nr:MAG: hypothetical protein OMM_09853 [Candidatus Magnetoglobus multicellularis str. Araruama]